jgi:hypothetical protein
MKLLRSSKRNGYDLIAEEQLCEAEERLRLIISQQPQSSAPISAQQFQQVVEAELRQPKIFGDSAIIIWLSKNRRLVSGVGQIAIAVTTGLSSAQIIDAFLSVGVTLWYITISKMMFFNATLVFWMSGMDELIEALPGSKGRLPLRLIATVG